MNCSTDYHHVNTIRYRSPIIGFRARNRYSMANGQATRTNQPEHIDSGPCFTEWYLMHTDVETIRMRNREQIFQHYSILYWILEHQAPSLWQRQPYMVLLSIDKEEWQVQTGRYEIRQADRASYVGQFSVGKFSGTFLETLTFWILVKNGIVKM